MENKVVPVEVLIERVETYGKTSYELIRLKTIDKTADLASSFISKSMIILFVFAFGVVLNIGIALWLGDLLGKTYLGFFCVSGFYGLVALIFYLFRAKIKEGIGNSLEGQETSFSLSLSLSLLMLSFLVHPLPESFASTCYSGFF